MTLSPAPFHTEISHGPASGTAHWAQASDGVRVRIAHWPLAGARGTALIFPGRTEYVEKYGQIAAALGSRGLAAMTIDWRGQGLAQKLLDNPLIGHVDRFLDYQKDVAALVAGAAELGLPRPYFLIAHSMGGAIGLRALMEGLDVAAVTFSGPMWGIRMAPHVRPAAWVLSHLMPMLGQGENLPPGTQMDHHVLTDGFEGNLLTRDKEQFEIMRAQLTTCPELILGGPSYIWLREALRETHALSTQPSPDLPCLTILGSNERIVDVSAIHSRMENWRGGRLEILSEGEHEVLMESALITAPIFDAIASLFSETKAA